jgi:hypothetical protein
VPTATFRETKAMEAVPSTLQWRRPRFQVRIGHLPSTPIQQARPRFTIFRGAEPRAPTAAGDGWNLQAADPQGDRRPAAPKGPPPGGLAAIGTGDISTARSGLPTRRLRESPDTMAIGRSTSTAIPFFLCSNDVTEAQNGRTPVRARPATSAR